MNLEKVTPSGEKHGLINAVANSSQDNGFKYMDAETKAKAEKLKKEDHRMVKAKYMNHRGRNERLTKPYCRWAGDLIQTWHFIPDEIYDVPKGLVDEVNAARLAERSEILDKKGVPSKKDGPGLQIHEFVPVGF